MVALFYSCEENTSLACYENLCYQRNHDLTYCKKKRFKYTLKVLLKAFGISHNSWEQAAMGRPKWRTSVRSGAKSHEANRIAAAEQRRQDRKSRASQSPTAATIPCPHCTRTLSSAEAPYGKFLILLRLGGARGTMGRGNGREPLFFLSPSRHSPRAAVFSLSPGLQPRNFYGQSSTKEASAEERGTRTFRARIGLTSHLRTHRDRLSQPRMIRWSSSN